MDPASWKSLGKKKGSVKVGKEVAIYYSRWKTFTLQPASLKIIIKGRQRTGKFF
jgi:hypothetical protein